MSERKLRMGMIGGGSDAFIGAVHRMGAGLDGQIDLVCGAFSSDPQKSASTAKGLYLPENRGYPSYTEMIEMESKLPEDVRMDFVSIVTPNVAHFDPAIRALDHAFPVIIDKPMTYTLKEARLLREKVRETATPFAVTYTYAAYPMIKQAMAMVRNGVIGTVRKVMMEYPQGWLTARLEDTGQKQASWRSDPQRAGISNCFGDIGTHCANMAEYISGQKITEVLAELNIVVEGRTIDDDANVFFHMENGATGVISASQVSPGEENNLKCRIYGDKGGLEWNNTDHNTLLVKMHEEPVQIYRSGVDNGYLEPETQLHTRTPSGHPEGYIEAFANIYRNFSLAVRHYKFGTTYDPKYDFHGVEAGYSGMAMISAVVESSKKGNVWVEVPH